MTEKIPQNNWQLYLDSVSKASTIIDEVLAGQPMGPFLNEIIYTLVFHEGVSAAKWINNNKALVERLNSIMSYTKDEMVQIREELRESVENLKAH